MAFTRLVTYLAAFLSFHSNYFVTAQYAQDYIPQNLAGGTRAYFFQATQADVPRQVVDLYPESVYLVYNCEYMKDICKNAQNFAATARGRALHPNSQLPNYVFGYDFNTGKRSSTHTSQRRSHTCPSSWKTTHLCPEVDQLAVMRNDGQWWYRDLEPGTTINVIRNYRGVPPALSKVRYTCDEFPPATFVEGGDNVDRSQPGETRCAAMRCSGFSGVKAEQDWQATAHLNLQSELKRLINRRVNAYGQFPYYQAKNSVAFFGFGTETLNNGIAARVVTYADPAQNQVDNTRYILQAKRQDGTILDGTTLGNITDDEPIDHWPAEFNLAELDERLMRGDGTQFVVYANASAVNRSNMNSANMPWDFEDLEDDEDDEQEEAEIKRNRDLSKESVPRFQPVMRSVSHDTITPLLKRATPQDIENAQSIVQAAMAESSKLNKKRLAKPLRNTYGLKPGTVIGGVSSEAANVTMNQDITPLLQITDSIAEAAALVAEAGAVSRAGNVTKRAVASSGTYWMGSITRRGTVPWGDDPAYNVYRNVLDYGAVGDGVTDDTKAIKAAMNNGTRCGEKCNGSTTKNAIVYFPPGTYLISTTIAMPFGTQVIGDANDRPILLASPSFLGLGVLSTDEYTGGPPGADGSDEEYYINTANFYRQIRNIIIDITAATTEGTSCLHYQVAQATSLQNVELRASAATSQNGMYAENGSGGQISDVTFTGGAVGLYGGNQQFTAQRLTFNGCTVGVQVIWDWGWVWKSITMKGVGTGFKLLADGASGNIGSISILDSSFTNVPTVVVIAPPSSSPGTGSTGVVLENVAMSGVTSAVADTAGKVYLDGSSALVNEWALGPVYEGSSTARTFSQGGKVGDYRRHSTLVDSTGAYFERAKPQYEDQPVSQFLSVKAAGATGDGTTDDTAAFQAALYASLGKILFVDAGSYILTSTVTIPSGAKIVGETWSQLVASGSYFEDASNPKVLLKVGNTGDVGNVEMQDLLFTTRGATAGLIVVEWNIQAATAGSAGLWDCHARIGGATGSKLTPAECPASTSGTDAGCSAASLMMHITPLASGYFENMWLWGADHMLDDPDLTDAANEMVQCSIYIARGFLIESTHATWLYATASEHSVFYQYNFYKATNVFAGMLQTESPYFQPNPTPPAPFTAVVGDFPNDPDYTCTAGNDFSGCDESWAVIITQSEDIYIAGAGIYSWFSTYSQTCIDTQQCQKALMRLDSNYANVRIQNLITIGAKYMVVMDGQGISAVDNLNVNSHPFWSQITILDVGSNTTQFKDVIWLDPEVWEMETPTFTCVPPCYVKIPPWTKATSTVNYPLMTVSDGTWTSTITQAPLTISAWVFETVTITDDGTHNAKRGLEWILESFVPIPRPTPYWPAIVYEGMDGQFTTTQPSTPFPSPPSNLNIDWMQPYGSDLDFPVVAECFWMDFDQGCVPQPWLVGQNSSSASGDDGDDDYNENWEDLEIICPASISVSSTTTKTTSTTTTTPVVVTTAAPAPSPFASGHPSQNKVACYNSGENTESVRMINAATSFCNSISADVFKPGYYVKKHYEQSYNGGWGVVDIVISMTIKPLCTWEYSFDICKHYLAIPTDSCDCGGVNGKHGGVVSNDCYEFMVDPNVKS